MGREIIVPKFLMSHCQEKLLVRKQWPVPQTDTGSRGENPKVSDDLGTVSTRDSVKF